MPDQVIIDMAYDPAAINAFAASLKVLGQLSAEQEQQLVEINKQYQANKTATTEAAGANVSLATAMKNVPMAALAGATEKLTEEVKDNTTAVKTNTNSLTYLREEQKRLKALWENTGLEEYNHQLLAVEGRIRQNTLEHRELSKALSTNDRTMGLVTTAASGLFNGYGALSEITAKLTGNEEESQKAMAKTQQSILLLMQLTEVFRAVREAGEIKAVFLAKARVLQEKLGITTKEGLIAAEKASAAATAESTASKEAEIEVNAQAIETETALYTTKWIENAATSESVIVRNAATIAQKALNAAMSSGGIAVVGVGIAAVAAYEAFSNAAKSAKEQQEDLDKAIEEGDKAMEERIRQIGDRQQFADQYYEKKIAFAKAEGKSEKDIMELEAARDKSDLEYVNEKYVANKTLFDYIAKNYEQMKDQAQEAADEAHKIAMEIARRGRGEEPQMSEKDSKLKDMLAEAERRRDLKQKQLKDFDDINRQLADSNRKVGEDERKMTRYLAQEELKDAKANADARVLIAKVGSEQELKDKIDAAMKQKAIDLDNANLTAGERLLIETKFEKDVNDMRREYIIARLNDDKAGLGARAASLKKNSQAEFDNKVEQLTKDRDIALAQANLTANQEENIRQTYYANVEKLTEEYNVKTAQAEIQAKITTDQAKLLLEDQYSKQALNIKRRLIEEERNLAILNAGTGDKSPDEQLAAVNGANAKAQADTAKAVATYQMQQDKMQLDAFLHNNNMKIIALQGQEGKEKEIAELEMANIKKQMTYNDSALIFETETYEQWIANKNKLDEQYAAAKQKRDEKQKLDEKQLYEWSIQQAKGAADAAFEAAKQRRENELTVQLQTLDDQKNSELLNATLTAAQRNAIEKKYRIEAANLKLQAWKADQKAAEEQALINGLLAFTSALATVKPTVPAGLVAGALALASSGVQAAIIASKPAPKFYAKGTKGSEVLPAGMKIVGEQGPEILWTPGGEKVITAPDTAKLLDSYRIPQLSTFPRIEVNDFSDLQKAGKERNLDIDYEKLSSAITRKMPAPVVNDIRIDENGFTKRVMTRGNRKEIINAVTKL